MACISHINEIKECQHSNFRQMIHKYMTVTCMFSYIKMQHKRRIILKMYTIICSTK